MFLTHFHFNAIICTCKYKKLLNCLEILLLTAFFVSFGAARECVMIFSSYSEQKKALAGIKLVSCGHIFAKSGRESYRPNGREDWLLFYVAKGEEIFFTDKTLVAAEGSFIIFAPGEKQHHIHKSEKTAEFYYVHFKCDRLPEELSLKTSTIYKLDSHKHFATVFEGIIEETLQKKASYELVCISRLLEMLSLIQRETAERQTELGRGFGSIAAAIQYMNRCFDKNITLGEYADMCCMSKYHFSRVFKDAVGVSPIEYRNNIRIEHAKEMLDNSFLSVGDIREALGYTSAAYFSYSFKERVGMSPNEYRERHKKP